MNTFVLALLLPIIACAFGLALAAYLVRKHHHDSPPPKEEPPQAPNISRERERWVTNNVGFNATAPPRKQAIELSRARSRPSGSTR